MINKKDDFTIFTDKATYLKNDEIVFTEGNSKAINENNTITASNFKFNKIQNILNAEKNVKLIDKKDDFTIFTDKATYLKNDEIVFTEGNSKAINENNTITASNFKFNKIQNILNAEKNVKLVDKKDDFTIFTDKATYLKNDEIVFTEGNSKAINENNTITASNFKFNKIQNILNAEKNVKLIDKKDDFTIFTDKATYLKNDEIVFTEGNSKAINENNTITASNFKFNKIQNILNAEKNVKLIDKKDDFTIFTDKATYLKNDEIVFTEGKTNAIVENKYEFISKNVKYNKNKNELSSHEKSTILDSQNIYNIDNFTYQKNQEVLKGKNLRIISIKK